MDLRLGTDLFDSFKKYQTQLIEQYDKMAEEFRFEVVDARKPPEEIQEALRSKIEPILRTAKKATPAPPLPETIPATPPGDKPPG